MVSSPEIAAALPLATMENVPEEISSAITESITEQTSSIEFHVNLFGLWKVKFFHGKNLN